MFVDVTAVFSIVLLASVISFIFFEIFWVFRRLTVEATPAERRLRHHDVIWSLIPASILILMTMAVVPRVTIKKHKFFSAPAHKKWENKGTR